MALAREEKEIGMPFEAGLDDAPPQKQDNTAGGGDGATSAIRYHAASIGGTVTAGCGEFMPSGEEGAPPSSKCAACDCHRKDTPHGGDGDGGAPPPTPPVLPSFASMTHRNNAWASLAAQSAKTPAPFGGGACPTTTGTAAAAASTTVATVIYAAAATTVTTTATATAAAIATAVTAAAGNTSCQDPANFNAHQFFGSDPAAVAEETAKKRVRTKFTEEQKDKMAEFAETIGWRIPREEENIDGVERFCGEIGVKRQVFKVWMQNNKSSTKNNKTSSSPSSSSSSSINN